MDSASLKQIPIFSGERKHLPVWLTKAVAICALNGFSSVLKPGFENMLSANDTNPLDKIKSPSIKWSSFASIQNVIFPSTKAVCIFVERSKWGIILTIASTTPWGKDFCQILTFNN